LLFLRREEFRLRTPLAFDVCRRGVRPGLPGGHALLRLDHAVFWHRSVHVHRLTAVKRPILGRGPEENRRDGRRRPTAAVVREHGPTDFSRHQSLSAKFDGTRVFRVVLFFYRLVI